MVSSGRKKGRQNYFSIMALPRASILEGEKEYLYARRVLLKSNFKPARVSLIFICFSAWRYFGLELPRINSKINGHGAMIMLVRKQYQYQLIVFRKPLELSGVQNGCEKNTGVII